MNKNRGRRTLAVIVISVVLGAALFVIGARHPRPTTIGQQIDFSVDRIESYGPACVDASGEGYRRVSTGEEVQEIAGILQPIVITRSRDQQTPTGFTLSLEIGQAQSLTILGDERILVNGEVFVATNDISKELRQLSEIYRQPPPNE